MTHNTVRKRILDAQAAVLPHDDGSVATGRRRREYAILTQ